MSILGTVISCSEKGKELSNYSFEILNYRKIDNDTLDLMLFGKETIGIRVDEKYFLTDDFISNLKYDIEFDLVHLGRPKLKLNDLGYKPGRVIGFMKKNHFKISINKSDIQANDSINEESAKKIMNEAFKEVNKQILNED